MVTPDKTPRAAGRETLTEEQRVAWTQFKSHLIGCASCTAGHYCTLGDALRKRGGGIEPWLRDDPTSSREAGAGEVETAKVNLLERIAELATDGGDPTERLTRIAALSSAHWVCHAAAARCCAECPATYQTRDALPPAGRREAEKCCDYPATGPGFVWCMEHMRGAFPGEYPAAVAADAREAKTKD